LGKVHLVDGILGKLDPDSTHGSSPLGIDGDAGLSTQTTKEEF